MDEEVALVEEEVVLDRVETRHELVLAQEEGDELRGCPGTPPPGQSSQAYNRSFCAQRHESYNDFGGANGDAGETVTPNYKAPDYKVVATAAAVVADAVKDG